MQNNMTNVNLSSSNIYQSSIEYNNKLSSEASRKKGIEKGEMVMSFSPDLCLSVVTNKYNSDIERFKDDFMNRCSQILNKNMEQQEFSMFIHEYDSKQMRVHAHVLFYPYIKELKKIKLNSVPNLSVRPLKVWIEEDILNTIKIEFNEYAKELYAGLEDKDIGSIIDIDDDTLFKLIKLSNLHPLNNNKDNLNDLWLDNEIKNLNQSIQLLKETSSDKTIDTGKDFSIIIDYLYDFKDDEIYKLFFEHPALISVLRKYSLNKSKSKFSALFLKLLHLSKNNNIIDLVIKKTANKKGKELKNILKNTFSGDGYIYDQLQSMNKGQTMS